MSNGVGSAAAVSDPTESARAAAVTAFAATKPVTARSTAKRGRPKGSGGGPPGRASERTVAASESTASVQAKTTAAVVLESLSGLRSAPDAARALGVTVARYYHVEAKAIAGLLSACEPAQPGPAPGVATERALSRLQMDHRRQEQELSRLRAVLRTTQRGLGLQPPPPKPAGTGSGGSAAGGKTRKARRPVVRALTVVRRLMAQSTPVPTGAISTTGSRDGTSPNVPGGG